MIGALALIVALIAVAALVGDWVTRNSEMDRLVGGIEQSEAAMLTAIEGVQAVLAEDSADEPSPQAAESLTEVAAEGLAAVAAAAELIEGLSIQPWHDDIENARVVYLEHNAAWQQFLAAAAEDHQEWFTNFRPIETTWDEVGPALRAAVPGVALWDVADRVEVILDEGDGGGDGGVQAAGRASAHSA